MIIFTARIFRTVFKPMQIAVFFNADSETPTWRRIKCCRQSRDVPTGNCLFFPIFIEKLSHVTHEMAYKGIALKALNFPYGI